MEIRFYRVNDEYGCFSNFSKHSFFVDDVFYRTSEHYFQAHKFLENVYKEEVLKAKTAREAANLGRDRKKPLRKDWEDVKDFIMKEAVYRKFTFKNNEDIKGILLSTGCAELIENTTNDYYWGCGLDGTGKNMLGKILMDVRQLIKEENLI